jgi:hypothetical protein
MLRKAGNDRGFTLLRFAFVVSAAVVFGCVVVEGFDAPKHGVVFWIAVGVTVSLTLVNLAMILWQR